MNNYIRYIQNDKIDSFCLMNGLRTYDFGTYKNKHLWLFVNHHNTQKNCIGIEDIDKQQYDVLSFDKNINVELVNENPEVYNISNYDELKEYIKFCAEKIIYMDNEH